MTAPVPVAGGEELAWTAPSDWEAKPASAMRKATYAIHGDNGTEAELSVTAFPGTVGGELANLNRWRGQLQLAPLPLPDGEAAAGVTHLDQAGLKLTLADFSSLPPALLQRMLGVIVPVGDNTWFFKLSGPAALLDQKKEAFLAFVKTIRPGAAPVAPTVSVIPPATMPMASTGVPTAQGKDLTWTAPGDWSAKPASAMRKATFGVPGDNGAEAELSITAFPGDVGGVLANLNRWRGQVQLPPLADDSSTPDVTRFEQVGLKFILADFTGAPSASPQRILGAIVPVGDATWFFKLSGPTVVIEKQKTAFLTFLKTVKAP